MAILSIPLEVCKSRIDNRIQKQRENVVSLIKKTFKVNPDQYENQTHKVDSANEKLSSLQKRLSFFIGFKEFMRMLYQIAYIGGVLTYSCVIYINSQSNSSTSTSSSFINYALGIQNILCVILYMLILAFNIRQLQSCKT